MLGRSGSILFAVAVLAASTGCVERRFRIESNPPGAYLYVNNTAYGPTPIDVPFLYYGKYDMMLVKEGFQTLRVKEPVDPPWYQYPVIDFFAEALYPGQLTDIRPLYYELEPVCQPNLDLLKAEGEELRRRAAALPPPRYPDPKKDRPADRPPVTAPPGMLPPPRPTPGPAPRPVEPAN
jgi:hypothetical protein